MKTIHFPHRASGTGKVLPGNFVEGGVLHPFFSSGPGGPAGDLKRETIIPKTLKI